VQIEPPRLGTLTITPTTVPVGQHATGTITVTRPSLAGDIIVDLISEAPGFATVPTQVTIGEGQLAASFPITTLSSTIPFPTAHADLQASYAGSTATAALTITSTVVAGILAALTLHPPLVTGGQPSRGTVTLLTPVPTDTVVGLAVSDTGGGHPPIHPGGSTAATVPVPDHPGRSNQRLIPHPHPHHPARHPPHRHHHRRRSRHQIQPTDHHRLNRRRIRTPAGRPDSGSWVRQWGGHVSSVVASRAASRVS
jgi:hypothetical protein